MPDTAWWPCPDCCSGANSGTPPQTGICENCDGGYGPRVWCVHFVGAADGASTDCDECYNGFYNLKFTTSPTLTDRDPDCCYWECNFQSAFAPCLLIGIALTICVVDGDYILTVTQYGSFGDVIYSQNYGPNNPACLSFVEESIPYESDTITRDCDFSAAAALIFPLTTPPAEFDCCMNQVCYPGTFPETMAVVISGFTSNPSPDCDPNTCADCTDLNGTYQLERGGHGEHAGGQSCCWGLVFDQPICNVNFIAFCWVVIGGDVVWIVDIGGVYEFGQIATVPADCSALTLTFDLHNDDPPLCGFLPEYLGVFNGPCQGAGLGGGVDARVEVFGGDPIQCLLP